MAGLGIIPQKAMAITPYIKENRKTIFEGMPHGNNAVVSSDLKNPEYTQLERHRRNAELKQRKLFPPI